MDDTTSALCEIRIMKEGSRHTDVFNGNFACESIDIITGPSKGCVPDDLFGNL